jgi:hypothetical protein
VIIEETIAGTSGGGGRAPITAVRTSISQPVASALRVADAKRSAKNIDRDAQ